MATRIWQRVVAESHSAGAQKSVPNTLLVRRDVQGGTKRGKETIVSCDPVISILVRVPDPLSAATVYLSSGSSSRSHSGYRISTIKRKRIEEPAPPRVHARERRIFSEYFTSWIGLLDGIYGSR